jgi:UDP:flavonoid glycosyltransferase YjiC (YdhE family)
LRHRRLPPDPLRAADLTTAATADGGVPLVVGGDTEDKPEVSARVAWSGVGVNLRTGRPDVPAIRKGAEEALGDSAYRTRARDLQAEYQRFQAVDIIVEITEAQA